MKQLANNSLHVIVAAVIMAICMLGGAYLVSGSIDRVAGQIPEFETAMKSLQNAVADRGGAAAAPAPAPRRRGPDPNKVYTLASAGAPIKGPADAKVTVVEFADFQ